MQPRRNASLVLASAFHENHVCCGYFDDVSTSFVESPAADRTFIWTWPVLLTVVALGVMGNGLILFAISRVERFQRPANYLVGNMSLASLLLMASTVSASAQKEFQLASYGPWSCRIYPLHMSMFPAEGFTVMRISLDRKRVLCQPLQRESNDLTLNKILQIWLAAMGLNLIQGLLFWDYDEGVADFKKCSDKNQSRNGGPLPSFIFLGFYFIAVFLLPCVTMMKDLVRLTKQLRFLHTCQLLRMAVVDASRLHERRKRLVRNAIVFTALFIALKLPIGAHYTIYRMPRGIFPDHVHDWSWEWRRFYFGMMMVHGYFYPVIVFWLGTDIHGYFPCCSCQSETASAAIM